MAWPGSKWLPNTVNKQPSALPLEQDWTPWESASAQQAAMQLPPSEGPVQPLQHQPSQQLTVHPAQSRRAAQAGWQGAGAANLPQSTGGLPDGAITAGRRLLQITASPGTLGAACSVGPTCQSLDVTCKLSISQVGLLMRCGDHSISRRGLTPLRCLSCRLPAVCWLACLIRTLVDA